MCPLPNVKIGSEQPLYNIGVVSRMTGISMATLRAWERRYNFPHSDRTMGGHRLYSEKDVIHLQWVKERIDEGMHTAQAIQALRHQEEIGHFALIEQFPIDISQDSSRKIEQLPKNYKEKLYQTLIASDLEKADTILGDLLAFTSPEELILEVIGPVMAQIGEAWETGEINVATEHLSTHYLRQRLMTWMINSPPPRSVPPIVLSCAPNEWHEGSLLILGTLLRRRRWPVAYLGQAMPFADLANFIHYLQPLVVVLVAMTEKTAAELVEWPKHLLHIQQIGKPSITYGGRIFVKQPHWREQMAGVYLGDTFSQGLNKIEELMSS